MDVEQGLLEEGEASSLVARLHESLNVSGMAAAERIQRRRADQDTALPDADRSYDGAARVADVHKVSARTRTILRPFRSTSNHRAQNQIVLDWHVHLGSYDELLHVGSARVSAINLGKQDIHNHSVFGRTFRHGCIRFFQVLIVLVSQLLSNFRGRVQRPWYPTNALMERTR